ncbi:MAG: histidinol-phosphate transaminase [Clostridia bacterium]|nr:histidinol-phosphate transaminase [Clostridia bacterium]
MSKFLNSKYKSLEVYTPGEQPQDKKYIKLNTNESPYPPSKKVVEAVSVAEIENLRLYSDPECKRLRGAIAELYGVEAENVYLSNGSDDILNFAFMAFASDNSPAVFPEISYGFYKVFAELHGIPYKRIPLCEDFSISPSDYYNANGLVVIANPNAPTGLALTLSEVESIVASNPENVVLIDEAYVDFGAESAVALTKKYKNLLVVQTFSKSRSMAGARLGFAIADKGLIDDLNRIKYSTNPYNVNRLTLVAGEAAIKENGYYLENCKKVMDARAYAKAELEALGFLVLDSKANFLFAKSNRIGGEELYLKLKENGILVRHFKDEKIKDYNRITVGTKEDMRILVDTVKKLLEE